MKRFVTYLYECERGNKIKNVGFIRVNVRGKETTLEVYIRNVARAADKGGLFLLIDDGGLQGIKLAEVIIANGQNDTRIVIETEDIKESGFSLNDIMGVGICFKSGLYIASCWKDEQVEEIVRGEFATEGQQAKDKEEEKRNTLVAAEESKPEKCGTVISEKKEIYKEEINRDSSIPTYEKIDLSQIRDLPSPNWYLATNSFLVHGFWNYGYLVLKKEMEKGEEVLSLGVPGIFEKPEAVMAVLFGFPSFETIPSELNQKEKNQETEEGTFGCWFVKLKI